MAHFAKLDINNTVTSVEVVSNEVILDADSNEVEQLGVTFLNELYGTSDVYKQTSYNGTIRKNYAGIGDTYDTVRDAFIAPQPYPSWVLNEATCQYESPIELPSDAKRNGGTAMYQWNEDTQAWDAFVE